jgi:phosphocarrier protein HPr
MVSREATIKNRAGIHVRPAGLIIEAVKNYPGKIVFKRNETQIVLGGVIDLLSFGLLKGDTLHIEVNGPKEKSVCTKLKKLLETEFDFPPRE